MDSIREIVFGGVFWYFVEWRTKSEYKHFIAVDTAAKTTFMSPIHFCIRGKCCCNCWFRLIGMYSLISAYNPAVIFLTRITNWN